MDLPAVARFAAASRVAIGAALLTAPRPVGTPWLGDVSERPDAQIAIAGLGARDLVIGAGTLWALAGRKRDVGPWLIAAGLADAADFAGAFRFRKGLSTASVAGTAALAGGSAALHAWLHSELG
jgi:hypothetical protein